MRLPRIMNGSTLVEMLIFMGILSIFLFILSQIFITLLDTMLESESRSNTDHDIRYVFERLSHDIGRADTVVIPTNLGSSTQILQLNIDGIIYTYSSASGKLIMNELGNDSALTGYDSTLHRLSFTKVGSSSGEQKIQVQLELKSNTITGTTERLRGFTTTLGAR